MRALLTENELGVGRSVEADLVAAGVEVHRCRPAGAAGYECEGMPSGHGCPLDHVGTDAVVAVRSRRGGPTTELEAGVACALRAGVPVALVGGGKGAGYVPWASVQTEERADAVAAFELAARRGREALIAPARVMAERVLGPDAAGCPIEVSVEFAGDRLRAEVAIDAPVDARTCETVAVRVAGVLRPRARWAKAVDVGVHGRPAAVAPS